MGLVRGVSYFCLFLVTLSFVPGLPPHLDFPTYNLKEVLPAEGPLTPNHYLDHAERLFENVLMGPESIAVVSEEEFYVGIRNGNIVRIWGKKFEHMHVIGNAGPPGCGKGNLLEETLCGRPLGLRWLPSGHLLIADAYIGILKMDVLTGQHEVVVNSSIPIDGRLPKLPDDLDVDSEGNIYWSDASTTSRLRNSLYEILIGPSGRLIKYDVKKHTNQVLWDKIHFANGVQLSHQHDSVLINECLQRRVLRYWIKGPKAGSKEILIDSLPGMPDKIRLRPEGGYYVSLIIPFNTNSWDMYRTFGNLPALRRLMIRVVVMLQGLADILGAVLKSSFNNVVLDAFNDWTMQGLIDPNLSMVLEIDDGGNILGSLQGHHGKLLMVSETQRVGNYLVFGSPYSPYLGRLSITELTKMKAHGDPTKRIPNSKTEL